ncbi:MAG: radical SAM/SPASM domain-containing protein [Candidatus Omnitrophota bacterium]
MSKFKNILKHSRILTKSYVVLPRIAKDYFDLLVLKKKVLRKVDIAIIAGCNAKCKFCFATTLENDQSPQLSLEEVKSIITQSIKLGAFTFEFIGGEPLMCHHLCDAIRFAKKSRSLVAVTTNGVLLTKKKVLELKEAGLDVVQISLDSADHKEHDESRGIKGCYEKIMQAIPWIRESGIELMLSTVATNQNLENDGLMKVIKFAEQLNVPITVNPASKSGEWRGKENILLTEKNKEAFHKIVRTSHARWAGQVNFLGDGCPCGKEIIYITAFGHVIPCAFIQISYGNIRNESLEQIWDRLQAHKLVSERKKTCIAALDKNFIDQYINPLDRVENLPVFIHDHPTYKNRIGV